MKYEVRMNGDYMNRFATYSEACELREWIERKWPMATVEIISLD
jgi:hypothetical protein